MSTDRRGTAPVSSRRDQAMTLPELLIVVALMGVLATVIAAAITVTFRTTQASEGRVNVARAEQNIDIWLPADLASTDVRDVALPAVDVSPSATPCGNCGTIDLSGANALQLAWTSSAAGSPPIEIITRVQYQYIEVNGEWQMQRIMCVGGDACSVHVVLHDLAAPDDPSTFNPDVDPPVWVMDVAVPAPNGLDVDDDSAKQVIITINGGGTAAGGGGGQNTVSLTAGGRTTEEIAPDEFNAPAFVRARSRCGGPISLLVDTSGSIPTAQLNDVVEPGVKAFINAFRDTPTQIQVIEFADRALPMGAGTGWHRYVDMTVEADVDALVADVESLSSRSAGNRTNWEEAFFRAFKNQDGTAAASAANRIVFFTDGVPTAHRRMTAEPSKPVDQFWSGAQVDYNAGKYDPIKWTAITGDTAITKFNQESFDRTDVLLDQNRGVDLIFVGVGGGLQSDWKWIQNKQAYTNPSADPSAQIDRPGKDILAELLANAPQGEIPAAYADGAYTNPETANYYLQTNFDAAQFAAAMRAAALKDCGGTLTVQTRLADGTAVGDEFVYENTAFRDDEGVPIDADSRRVTTSTSFRTGTFDFEISDDSEYFDVDVVPQEMQTLVGYGFDNWACRSGSDPRAAVAIPIADSTFTGITVRVRPNEAVSCVLTVTT